MKIRIMMPKISIIMPCYGVEKYLDRCMDSLVEQTLKDIEIILVDDKSPDRIPEMCDDWANKDPRVKVIHKAKNEGLGYARNTGLEIATGEYIAFVDSDDFVNLSMYQILYDKVKEKSLDAAYCNCIEYVNEENQKEDIDVEIETDFFGREQVDDFLLDMIGPKPNYPQSVKYRGSVWHAIYKHSIFQANNIKFVSEREYVSEDLFFDVDYIPHCERITWIPQSLYYHCYNGVSLSHTVNDEKYGRMKKFIDSIDIHLNKKYPKNRYWIHLQRYCIFIYLVTCKYAAKGQFQSLKLYDILKDEFWKEKLKGYPIRKMTFKYFITLSMCKYKILQPFSSLLFKHI